MIVEKGSIEKFLIWFFYQIFGVRERTEGCVFNHLSFQYHVSTIVEAWLFPSRSQSKNFSFEQTFRLKRCRFSSMQQKVDGTKVPKGAMIFDSTRYSNSIFSEISGSICCIKISIDSFWSCHKSNDWIKSIGLVSPMNVSIENSINVEKESIEKFLIWFMYQNFDVRERTEGCVLNHVGFQNYVSTLVEARNFPSRSQSKNISFEQTFRLKRCRFSSLQEKPGDPKVPKVSMNFGLSLYSNSFFSESSSANCSIKTSIDFFGVVTNQSIKSNQLVWFLPSTCQSKAL